MLLNKDEIKSELIAQSKIFHFGTLSFTSKCAKEATCYALDCTKKNNVLISFDPNLRKPLWNNLADAKWAMDYGMQNARY